MSIKSATKGKPSAVARRHLQRAYRYDGREELEAALVECEAALQLAGDWAEAHNLHGIILEGLGRRPEALAAYTEALRLDASFEEAQENLTELEAELAGARSASRDLDEGLPLPESSPLENPVALPPSGHAPACEVCGRQDETLREALYPYVFSALIVTFRRGFAGRWCRRHRDLRLGLAGLITVTVGWLGIPWGLFYTPLALLKLARGGARLEDSNVELLTELAGHKLAAGTQREAAACLEECLRYGEQPQVLASLRDLYQTYGRIILAPGAGQVWSFLRAMLFAALLGGAIGLIDFALTLGFSAFLGEGSFLLVILSWMPFVALLYFGGLALARLVEVGLTRCRCRQVGLAGALGALSALLMTYGVLQGVALGDALLGWAAGAHSGSPGDLLLTAGAVLVSGGALNAAEMLARASAVDLIYLALLVVATVYYVAIGLSTAQSTARWQQRLAAARQGVFPDRGAASAPGWAAMAGAIVLLALLGVLFPHDQLVAENRAWSLVDDGLALIEMGDLEGATDRFEEAVRLRPDLSGTHYYLAWSYAAGDDPEAAIAEFEEAIRLEPGNAAPYEGLGWVYRMVGELGKSVESYQAAIQRDPAFADAHSGLGMAYLAQGNLEPAEAALREALDLDPESAEAHMGVGEVQYVRGDYDLAAASFSAVLRLEPENASAHNSLGWAEYYRDRREEACQHFQEAVRLAPWLAEAHDGVGWCHIENGALVEAVEAFQIAIEMDPELAQAYNGLGWAYYYQDRFDEAVTTFETALDLDPALAEARFGLNRARVAQDDSEQ